MRRYGHWAGKEAGYPENREYCIAEVPVGGRSPRFKQCGRKRGFGPGSEYCRQHAAQVEAGRKVSVGVLSQSEVSR